MVFDIENGYCGRWIVDQNNNVECPDCGERFLSSLNQVNAFIYCPACGSDMLHGSDSVIYTFLNKTGTKAIFATTYDGSLVSADIDTQDLNLTLLTSMYPDITLNFLEEISIEFPEDIWVAEGSDGHRLECYTGPKLIKGSGGDQ